MKLLDYKKGTEGVGLEKESPFDTLSKREQVEFIINHPFLKKIGNYKLQTPFVRHNDFLPYYFNDSGEKIDNHYNLSNDGINGIIKIGNTENKEKVLESKYQSKLASIFSPLNISPILEYKGEYFSLDVNKIPEDILNNLGVIENIVLVDLIYYFIAKDVDHFALEGVDKSVFMNNSNIVNGSLRVYDLDSSDLIIGNIRDEIDLEILQERLLDKYGDILELPYLQELVFEAIDYFDKYINYLRNENISELELKLKNIKDDISLQAEFMLETIFWKYIQHASKFLGNFKFEYSEFYPARNGGMTPEQKKKFINNIKKVKNV